MVLSESHLNIGQARTVTMMWSSWLLEKGADIKAKDIEGKTPLHCASENGHVDAVPRVVLEDVCHCI